jgi:hypothetical protein
MPWTLTVLGPTIPVAQIAVYTPTPASRNKVQPRRLPCPPLEETPVPQTPQDTRSATSPIYWGSWTIPDTPGNASLVAGPTATLIPQSYNDQAKSARKTVVGLSTFLEAAKPAHAHLIGCSADDNAAENGGVSGRITSSCALMQWFISPAFRWRWNTVI